MIDGPVLLSRRPLLTCQQDVTGRENFLTVRPTFSLEPAAEPSEGQLVFHCMLRSRYLFQC